MHSHLEKLFLCLYIQNYTDDVTPCNLHESKAMGPGLHKETDAEAADQQLASMVAVRDSLQAQQLATACDSLRGT